MRIILTALLSILSLFDSGPQHAGFHNITFKVDANKVRDVCQDTTGLMWIGTSNGLMCYDGYSTVMYQGWDDPDAAITEIFDMIMYDGYIAVGTERGLRFFDPYGKGYCSPFPELAELPSARLIHREGDTLWIITREEQCYSFRAGRLSLQNHICYRGINLYPEVLGRIMAVIESRKGGLLIGTDDGLFHYDGDHLIGLDIVEGNSVRCLERDNFGLVLVGTEAGLYLYDEQTAKTVKRVNDTRIPDSLANNELNAIFVDREGNIWICTDFGISISQQNRLYSRNSLAKLIGDGRGNHFMSSMSCDSELWLGGDNGLIHIKKDGRIDWFCKESEDLHLKHNVVRKVFKDHLGQIWIASDGGIARYDRREDRFKYLSLTSEDSRTSIYSYDIIEDADGMLWVATFNGGIFVIDPSMNEDEMFVSQKAFGNAEGYVRKVFSLSSDDGRTIWAAGSDGVVSIDNRTKDVTPGGFWASSIIADKNGLWYTAAGNICHFSPENKRTDTVSFRSGTSQIYSFIKEDRYIWFTTMDGMFYFDVEDRLVRSTGIKDNSYRTACLDYDTGNLIFGGKDVVSVVPCRDKYRFTSSHPVRVIGTDGSWKSGNHIRFSRPSNAHILVSSLSFKPDRSDEIYYRFDSDTSWEMLPSGSNVINVANLHGGRFILYLSSSNPDVDPGTVVSEYVVDVPYPWYLSLPACLSYLLFVLAVVWLAVRRVRRSNEEKLARKEREKSLELSNLKTDFFVNISHELKTPLSLILAPLERLVDDAPSPKMRESLKQIQRNALKLSALVYKVLDFRQVEEEDENSLVRTVVDLCTMAQSCVEGFRPLAVRKGIEMRFSAPSSPILMSLDLLKMESVLSNLLSNAIKYAPEENGIVEMSLCSKDGDVVVTVSDNGPGIDKSDLPLVFVRFYKGKHSKSSGSGIGLSLVKKFVELHSGTIEAESGGGTRMVIHIPLDGANVPAEGQMSDLQEGGAQDEQLPRILIIDDNAEIVDLLTESLSRRYSCYRADNGESGLRKAVEVVPDCIIVDQMMPVMDGLTFCKNLKKNLLLSSVPVIMLTAKDDPDTELESMKAGVDSFMSKPFELKKLQLRLSQLLERKRYLEQKTTAEAILESRPAASGKTADELLMDRMASIVEEHMDEESFNVSALARALEMDNKKLYRKILQLTGMTPVSYLRKLRIRRAAHLIEQGGYSISEVMYMVGYVNASHFSSNFNDEFGMTPRNFQKNLKKMSEIQ